MKWLIPVVIQSVKSRFKGKSYRLQVKSDKKTSLPTTHPFSTPSYQRVFSDRNMIRYGSLLESSALTQLFNKLWKSNENS